ncbi:MAG: hypothetical protein V3S34_02480, partial [Hyphomicrobium sp.]
TETTAASAASITATFASAVGQATERGTPADISITAIGQTAGEAATGNMPNHAANGEDNAFPSELFAVGGSQRGSFIQSNGENGVGIAP